MVSNADFMFLGSKQVLILRSIYEIYICIGVHLDIFRLLKIDLYITSLETCDCIL
jgi:hypothetical protein